MSRVSIVVRRIGPEAAEPVLGVIRAAFGARPALDPPADALAEELDSVRAALAADGGLLAELAGEPVGALLLEVADGTLFLRRVGVVPGAQHHGVGSELVTAALTAAVGHQRISVVARTELPATIDFWERHGFTRVGGRPPYVRLERPGTTAHDVPDAAAMRALGRRVAEDLRAGDLVVLSGGLGAGKTTFTQGLGAGLGVRGDITSPTFVIARVHPSLRGGPSLVHADAYRLGGIAELDDLDLDTSIEEAVTVVEWGSGIAEGLAESRLEVRITRTSGADPGADAAGESRHVLLAPAGRRWLGAAVAG